MVGASKGLKKPSGLIGDKRAGLSTYQWRQDNTANGAELQHLVSAEMVFGLCSRPKLAVD